MSKRKGRTAVQKSSGRDDRSSMHHGISSFTAPRPDNFLQKIANENSAMNRALKDRLGCVVPPFDPLMLLALTDSSGYLSAGHYWKASAIVGQGYDCSDRLREHLRRANERETFQDVLDAWAFDIDQIGNGYIEVSKTANSYCFYNMSAVKTRIRPVNDGRDLQYVNYEFGPGLLAYTEHDEFQPGMQRGVRHAKLLSRRGNAWYGDPVYISARRPLSLNISVLQVAEKFFENSLISDMAITLKGTELDKEEREQMRQYLANHVKGVDNAHKILFFEVGPNEEVVFEPLNTGIKDADFSKFRQDNRDESIAANLVPLKIIGVSTAGQLGNAQELEGMLKSVKIALVDPRQRKYEEWWQQFFEDLGLPDPESFKLNPLDVAAGTTDMNDLATGVQSGVLSPQQANEEWNTEKSALDLLQEIRKLNEGLEETD